MSVEFYKYLCFAIPPVFLLMMLAFLNMRLKTLQALYLIGGAAVILIQQLIFPEVSLITIIVSMVFAEIVHFILLGVLGNKIAYSTYSSLLVFMGLSPWWIGVKFSVIYIVLALVFIFAYSFYRVKKASKHFSVKNAVDAKSKLSTKDYGKFTDMASIVIASPIAIALLWTIILIS